MSDAPGQVADAPLIAVLVDQVNVLPWVAASVAALRRRHRQLLVFAAGRPPTKGPSRAPGGPSDAFDIADEPQTEVVRLAEADLETALREVGLIVDLRRAPDVRAHGRQVVFTVRHGAIPAASSTALVREQLAGRRTVTTTVVATDAARRDVVMAVARTALNRRSLTATRAAVARKSPTLLLQGLDSYLRSDEPPDASPGVEEIGNLAVGIGAFRLGGYGLRSLYASLTKETSYAVAWGKRAPSDSPIELPRQMNWVAHPHDRFLADPFLARHDDQTFVFVEDFSHATGYATIGVFEPRAPAATFRTVLDRGSHLSYPFVFRDNGDGDWLMLPEMAAENRVTLFRAAAFPDEWREEAVLLEGVNAYDPTIVFRDGRYWLFYAGGTDGHCFNDELHLASSERLRGPYTPHPRNPVKSDVIGSRPAGRLFDWNGRLIRPAQDSSSGYGYAVVFNEVTELTATSFTEKPIGRLEPDWTPGIRSTHSWDFLEDIVVADARRVRPKRRPGLRVGGSRSIKRLRLPIRDARIDASLRRASEAD